MALDHAALLEVLEAMQAAGVEERVRTAAQTIYQALIEAEVTAVATFYSMYRRTPTGEYLVGVCTNTLCAIMGGDAILDSLQDHLGVHAGETTEDLEYTLETVACIGACAAPPSSSSTRACSACSPPWPSSGSAFQPRISVT